MGPLKGYRIIELAGLGPGPMGAMMLGDMGADVIRVDRPVAHLPERYADPRYDVHSRSRRSVAIDLRSDAGRDCFLELAATADGIIEPFRPGVAERLGIGPDQCIGRNPRLNYLRITGWGQTGPLASTAGHDINYIALTGLLNAIGEKDRKPIPPLNIVGDFGGGGMLVALGMTGALLETAKSGKGQVIDAAMVDGAALLFASAFAMHQAGLWRERGSNQVDGGAPYYQVYETADGKYISIGAVEPQFFKLLSELVPFETSILKDQYKHEKWPAVNTELAKIFVSKTRDEWDGLLQGTDACYAPVLDVSEAPDHPHARARDAYIEVDGILHPAPAPRFSRTPSQSSFAPTRGEHTAEVFREIGFEQERINAMQAAGAIGTPPPPRS